MNFFSVFEPLTEAAAIVAILQWRVVASARGGTTPQAREYRHSVVSATGLAAIFLPTAAPVDDAFARARRWPQHRIWKRRKALLDAGGLGQLFG
jgi:hypothetical protein